MDRHDWNRRYAERESVWGEGPNRFLVEEVSDLPPGRALDVAAGEGRNAIWLAGRGFDVVAVDYSDVAVDKARRLAELRGVRVRWIRADVLEHPFGTRAFDLVLVFYLQLPWQQMRAAVRRAAEAVREGGTFLLVGHDRTNLERGHGGPKDPGVLYTPDDVAGELRELVVVEAARRRRPVETPDGERVAIDCLVRATRPRVDGASGRRQRPRPAGTAAGGR